MATKRIATIQERLTEALTIREMKQIELCRATGIPRDAISHYVRGKAVPRLNRIELISEALDVSVGWLLGYDVPMN